MDTKDKEQIKSSYYKELLIKHKEDIAKRAISDNITEEEAAIRIKEEFRKLMSNQKKRFEVKDYKGVELVSALWGYEIGMNFERIDKDDESRGHETIMHYFSNLSEEKRDKVIEYSWDKRRATKKQIGLIRGLSKKHNRYLLKEDMSILEAKMLIEWLQDFDNLDKKPYFDLDYIIPYNS